MKVVLATPLYPPDSGGPATDTAHLEACFPREGIEPVVCSFGAVRHLPRLIRHIRYGTLLYAAARGADAIVSMDTFSVCVPAAVVAKLRGIPLVVRVPGDFSWEQATQRFGVKDTIEVFQTKRYGLRVETIRTLQRMALRSAVRVVAPSDFFLGLMSGWGIRSERLSRVYLGIDLAEPWETPAVVPQGNVIFSSGRFVPWKGFDMLVELMPELPDWYLVIVGDGPERPALMKKVQELGLGDRVSLPGFLPREEVLGWYHAATAYVLNTAQENFSFQVAESMQSGIPTITTAIGSIPELITNGVEGVLCTPNDRAAFLAAIRSVVAEPEVWKRRTRAAQEKVKKFSIENSAHEFAKVIKEVCA